MEIKIFQATLIFSILTASFSAVSTPICKGIYSDLMPAKVTKVPAREVSTLGKDFLNIVDILGLATVFTKPDEAKMTWKTFESLKILRLEVQKYADFLSMLVPWSRRLLVVPFMISDLKHNQFLNPTVPINIADNYIFGQYWESQIFGRIDLDNVESFEFTKNPPDQEFAIELKKRNIKIYDGRTQPAKLWDGLG